MNKLIIFDFDYTLATSEIGIIKTINFSLLDNGFKEKDTNSIKKTIGLPLKDTFSTLLNTTDNQLLDQCTNSFLKYEKKFIPQNTNLLPNVYDTLLKLQNSNCILGIISNKPTYLLEPLLKKLNISNCFQFVIGSDTFNVNKPNPRIIYPILKNRNIPKSNIILVGDSTTDAKLAQNTHIPFIGITTGPTPSKELSKYPNLSIINSFENLLNYI